MFVILLHVQNIFNTGLFVLTYNGNKEYGLKHLMLMKKRKTNYIDIT